jgi:chromosome segregation ATPase
VEIDRRLALVEGKEAQRGLLITEIASLEERRIKAQRQADEAEKNAADALRMQSQRDRTVKELREAELNLGKKNTEFELLKTQVSALRSEEATITKGLSGRAEDVSNLEKRRDELFASIKSLQEQKLSASREAENALKSAADAAKLKTERDSAFKDWQEKTADLARVQTDLEVLRAKRNAIVTDDAAAKRSDAARAESEKSLATLQDELRQAQQQLLQAKNELARFEQLKRAAQIDQTAAERANATRLGAEHALAQLRDETTAVESRLSAMRQDVSALERRRGAIVIDDAAAKRAEDKKTESEKALQITQTELAGVQQQVAEARNDLIHLQRLKATVDVDEEIARRTQVSRAESDKRLADSRRQLADILRQTTEANQRRDALYSEIQTLENAKAEMPATTRAPTPPAPPRRPELSPGQSPAPVRPTPRPPTAPIQRSSPFP